MNVVGSRTVALIVIYHPERDKIRRLIDLLYPQVDRIIILDNGAPSEIVNWFIPDENLTYLPMSGNLGIGAALNIGLNQAIDAGCSHIITFDQDSAPYANMVEHLLRAMKQLSAEGRNVAAVGPCSLDHRHDPPRPLPFYRKDGWHVRRIHCGPGIKTIEVDALITSGCLYPVHVFKEVTLFDEGLFIDYIDTDWCFKARAKGFSLFGVCDAIMNHELGDGETREFAAIRLVEYGPLRRYYYFRNTIHFIRRSYVSWFWKLKLAIGLLVRMILLPVSPGGQKWRQLALMIKGVAHGLVGITGPIK